VSRTCANAAPAAIAGPARLLDHRDFLCGHGSSGVDDFAQVLARRIISAEDKRLPEVALSH